MGAGQIDIDWVGPEAPNAEAGEGAFAHLLTPAHLRFVRCHFPVPDISAGHALEIAGAVVERRRLPLGELHALPAVRLTVVTECAGNGRGSLSPKVGGEQWSEGAVSTAQWTGVPLSSVLQLRDTAVEVVFTGADGGQYQRSLPREVAMDPGTLLAWEMNGAPIPPVFGGPLRLIVPGWYGMASVKWLARVEAVERPFDGQFQSQRYVYGPGEPVTRIQVKSIVTEATATRIAGLAWGGAGVVAVAVWALGEWRPARLTGPVLRHAWRRWELSWSPPRSGHYLVRCRATDARGVSQPLRPRWNPLGYGANGVQCARMLVAVSR